MVVNEFLERRLWLESDHKSMWKSFLFIPLEYGEILAVSLCPDHTLPTALSGEDPERGA